MGLWEFGGANTPPSTGFDLQPRQTGPQVGDTIEVDAFISGAAELYGLQVTCTVDPAVLAWGGATFGNFFTNPLVGSNQADAAAGTWTGAVSQKNPAPALSGAGLFATFTFSAVGPGTTTINCEPLAATRDGTQLSIAPLSGPITVGATIERKTMQVNGSATYQGRKTHSNIVISLLSLPDNEVTTNGSGQFGMNGLAQGNYTLQADQALYLPSCQTLIIIPGETVTLASTVLAGGDTDDNGQIKINDATLIGSNFGLSDTTPTPPNPQADINADGRINVLDLTILASNFGKEGCQAWEATPPPSLASNP
jgi:hypothetical protein